MSLENENNEEMEQRITDENDLRDEVARIASEAVGKDGFQMASSVNYINSLLASYTSALNGVSMETINYVNEMKGLIIESDPVRYIAGSAELDAIEATNEAQGNHLDENGDLMPNVYDDEVKKAIEDGFYERIEGSIPNKEDLLNVYEDFANNSHEYTPDGLDDKIGEIRATLDDEVEL